MSEDIAPYVVLVTFLATGAIFLALTFLVSKILRPNKPDASKLSTYECGEEALGSGQIQFNSRFFVIALLFVLFEVELIFLFPWAIVAGVETSIDSSWKLLALIEMAVFVLVLAVGLVYAWAKGHLDWIKPTTKPSDYFSKVPTKAYDRFL